MTNRNHSATVLAFLAAWALPAFSAPVEVILEVELSPPTGIGEPTYNIVSAYGSNIAGTPIQEQFFTSLQSKLVGNFRVLVDPANPTSIEFMPGGYIELTSGDSKIWTGVTTDTPATPGNAPANLAGQVGSSLFVALRGNRVEFVSPTMTLSQPGGALPSQFAFDAQQVGATMSTGTFEYSGVPFLGNGSVSVAGIDLGNNLSLNSGFFDWGPLSGPGETGVFGSFDFYYELPLIPSIVTLVFQGSLQMEGRFSLDNVATVSADGQTVEVLGGPSTPGGVSAAFTGISGPGTFTAQQIGLNGLPFDALEQAASIPNLAYSIDLLGDDLQIWDLNFDQSFASADVTLGFSSILLPALITADDLVLYHFDESRRAWIEYTNPTWNLSNGTVKYTNPTFGLINGVLEYTNPEFSPFIIAVRVPEASTFALCSTSFSLMALTALRRHRVRKLV